MKMNDFRLLDFYPLKINLMKVAILVLMSKTSFFIQIVGPEFAFGAGGSGFGTGTSGHGSVSGTATGSGPSLKQVDRVRSVFPETWLWYNTTTG